MDSFLKQLSKLLFICLIDLLKMESWLMSSVRLISKESLLDSALYMMQESLIFLQSTITTKMANYTLKTF